MYNEADYGELWNEMDELLIQYPELSELWLDRDKLAALRRRFQSRDELREYFRKRAFTSLVMEKIFRVYELSEGETSSDGSGEEEEETITIDNEELRSIWEQDVKDEYSDFPEFIDFVEKNIFTS